MRLRFGMCQTDPDNKNFEIEEDWEKKSKKRDQSFGIKNSNFDPQTKQLDESTFKKSNSYPPEKHSGSDWHGGK